MKIMDIYAKKGAKVRHLHPSWGSSWDVDRAQKHLKVGEIYTIDYIDVLQSGYRVYLEEFPKVPFSHFHFEDLK